MHKKITVNGDVMLMPVHANLSQLMSDDLGYAVENNGIGFIVALNTEIKPMSQWQSIELHDGDYIDILGAITGG